MESKEVKDLVVGYDKRLGEIYVEYRTGTHDHRLWLGNPGDGDWSIKTPRTIHVKVLDENEEPVEVIVQTDKDIA